MSKKRLKTPGVDKEQFKMKKLQIITM